MKTEREIEQMIVMLENLKREPHKKRFFSSIHEALEKQRLARLEALRWVLGSDEAEKAGNQ